VLQLEGGSFAGTVAKDSDSALVAFDVAGQIKWTVPGAVPVMSTLGGGLVARGPSGLPSLDATGSAETQLSSVPTYSWFKRSYTQAFGSVAQMVSANTPYGFGWASTQGGNLSQNGSAISIFDLGRFPIHGLKDFGGSCRLDSTGYVSIELAEGQVFDRYVALKSLVLQAAAPPPSDQGLRSPLCSSFRTTQDPNDQAASFRADLYDGKDLLYPANGQPILDRLAVLKVFDGQQSTESLWDAGLVTREQLVYAAAAPRATQALHTSPVCGLFLDGGTRAATQATPRPDGRAGFGIYLDTGRPNANPNELAHVIANLTTATLVHETLHSLTRLGDRVPPKLRSYPGMQERYDLQTFVGLLSADVDSIVISNHLVAKACVSQ
jgi:hypothetical protein